MVHEERMAVCNPFNMPRKHLKTLNTLSRSSCYFETHGFSMYMQLLLKFKMQKNCKISAKTAAFKNSFFLSLSLRMPTDVGIMSLRKAVCKEQKIRPVCAHTPTEWIFHTVSYRHTHTQIWSIIDTFLWVFTEQQSHRTTEGTSAALITNTDLLRCYHIHTPVHNQTHSLWSDSSKHTSGWTLKC